MGFGVLAVVMLAVFAVRVGRDRRRVSNGVYLLLGLMFAALWLLERTAEVSAVVGLVAVLLIALSPLLLVVLGGLLIANGVVMLRTERRTAGNLLSLAAGIGVIALLAAVVAAALSRDRWFIALVGSAGLVATYLGFVLTSFLLYAFVYGRIPVKPGADAIVALGSGLRGSRVPPLLASRLDRAAALYRAEVAAGNQPVLITSGGRGPGEDVAEAVAMADYLVGQGIPAERIRREDRSTNTVQNLRFSKELAGDGARMVVVTNNFHVLRAATVARHLRLDAEVVGSPTARYYLPSAMLREFVAILARYPYLNAAICLALASILPLALLAGGY